MSGRDAALKALCACRTDGAWSDGALRREIRRDGLDEREAALASELCYGVLQNRMLLDERIDRFARGKLQPVVREILRIAVYQLTMLDRIPPSAAVNEAVKQAKSHANERAAGLVNAVLRNLLRNINELGMPKDLSVRYSHPEDLVALLRDSVGDAKLESLLASDNRTPATFVQVNELCTDVRTVADSLGAAGLRVKQHPWLDGCLQVSGGSIERTQAFENGWIYVQDPAARLAALCANPEPGMDVLDCCAAPGGKSFAAAIQMKNSGSITSCDVYPHKIQRIESGAERLGISCIHAVLQDATAPREDWSESFDVVLADVPCSGLGVIRKKPEIRYKELAPLEQLPELQGRILQVQSGYVKPGGMLIYSTCTVLRRENEAVVAAFLQENPAFSAEAFTLPNGKRADNCMLTLLPCDDDTDGFFICKLRRTL